MKFATGDMIILQSCSSMRWISYMLRLRLACLASGVQWLLLFQGGRGAQLWMLQGCLRPTHPTRHAIAEGAMYTHPSVQAATPSCSVTRSRKPTSHVGRVQDELRKSVSLICRQDAAGGPAGAAKSSYNEPLDLVKVSSWPASLLFTMP